MPVGTEELFWIFLGKRELKVHLGLPYLWPRAISPRFIHLETTFPAEMSLEITKSAVSADIHDSSNIC